MRRRTIKKNIWLNYNENRQLKKIASLIGLSEADTIRKLLYEVNIKPLPPKEFYYAVDKIIKIEVTINRLIKILNIDNKKHMYELDNQLQKIDELVDKLKETYL